MKKVTKSIITSSLLALAFGAMSVGTTFALFTSQAKTTISVESGLIDLKAPISVDSAWELGNVPMVGSEFNYQNSIGGSITKDENNIVHLNKLAPGDGAIFALTPNNFGTNINIKARLVVTLEGNLAGALNVEVKAGENKVIGFKGAHTGYTPWEEVAVGSNPTAFNVKVEFPDGDSGEILFGEANHDNQYQNKTATLVIGYEAVQGNAQTDDILQVINTKLMTEAYLHGENETMYDALQDLSSAQVAAIETKGYVWSVEEDQFYNFTAVPTAPYKFFKMFGEMPDTQTYSIYATGTGWTTVELTGVGFDAGGVSGITSVSYVGASDARTNIIRTNTAQTTLTINAPKDTIHHYDALGALNIIEAATASYHEFGSIAYAEIARGRIVLEEGSDVNQIHINKKTDSTFDTVIIANNGGADELPEKITRDAVTVEQETLVVKVESNGSSENVYVYADGVTGTKGSTEKVTEGENKQNEYVESDLGQLVLDNGSAGEKAQTVQEKADEKTEVVEDAIDKESAENDVFILANGADESTGVYKTLAEFRDAVNSGTSYAGYTVTLARNVNLKNALWTPIGNASNPFRGVFDGNEKTIKKFTVNSSSGYAGLFGEIHGTQNASAMNLETVYANDTFIDTSFVESNYSAVVKDLTISEATVTETGSKKGTGALAGRINDAYIENIVVSSSTITGYKAVGGISGCFNGSMAKNCKTLSNVSVFAGNNGYHAAGLFGGVIYEESASQSNYTAVVSCENNASVTVLSNGATGGSIGGIAAWSQNFKTGNSIETSGAVYINCVNNGNLQYMPASCSAAGGIAGFGNNGVAFMNCANTGNITVENITSSTGGGIAGIAFGGYTVRNCSNSGTLTGTTSANTKMAGVYIDYTSQTGGTGVAYGCTNTGTLVNYDTTPGRTAQIAFAGGLVSFANQVFNTVQDVQNALLNNGNYSYEFINCSVLDKTGVLDLTGTSGNIHANNNICNTIRVTDSNVAIDIPGVSVIVPSDVSGFSLSSTGDNSSISVAANATVNNITLGGYESSIVVYGTVNGSINLSGNMIQATIEENAFAGKVNFNGTGSYVLTNRGTISHTPSTAQRNEHTLSTITACNIVVNNYGLIEAKNYNDQPNSCAYAMLFYNGCDVVVNHYYGSSIVTESDNMEVAPYTAHSVIYNYYDVDGNLTNTVVKK